ncbi:site-specific DNA-methyltransferase [Pantoea stewartii subsp. indologenes]|uniref:DNA-methyltransferase n=1 Tax=Pantoea stewartii TaxID=66269 RepID=UPI0024DF98B7|nr:site-specific DNA-methyltransferase [Pantoea stewartii]MDK2631973.1 site-specific DNA-methyltransferase [Pantoea stewartii subsp. indologenes]
MTYQIHIGRCEEIIASMPDNSIDSIVTDPPYGISIMGHKWDYQVPSVEQWEQCLRVLKPGGYLLAFSSSRTYHRMVVNVEDAGFEIRDQIMWIYGSGFPKSKNLKDEHSGKGTALKPAHEPIVMARKPLSGTIEANFMSYGTGVINIDDCRVPVADQLGRWPANLIHDGSEDVIAAFPDAKGQQGDLKSTGRERPAGVCFGDMAAPLDHSARVENSKSAARFFYCAKVTKTERDEGLERFNLITASEMTGGRLEGSAGLNNPRAGAGRTSGAKNNHSTVKPVALMRYLCKLVTPAGGLILDPFMGSGSTGKAALLEGFSFAGIEMEPDSATISAARIAHAYKQVNA